VAAVIIDFASMSFASRLATLRKQRRLTQTALAERVGVHVSNVRRYEAGSVQPTAEVVRNLALALNVSADALLFDEDERGPSDQGVRLLLEALDELDPDELAAVRSLIEGALLRHQSRRLVSS
jgi:transcriptional regulator with XRE-family HTH domain